MDARIVEHVRELNRCNQRGGRMLSIRDLIDACTLNHEMAAYLLASISMGRSFLVGAKPGGAGKTTVMVALLNFIPDIDIVPTESTGIIQRGLTDSDRHCYLAHEIGHGRWYAYIWGDETTDFLRLSPRHMIASNLHADDLSDILATPGIDEENITNLDMLLFVRVGGSLARQRRVSSIWERQGARGSKAFVEIFRWDEREDLFQATAEPCLVGSGRMGWARGVIDGLVESNLRTIEDVRQYVLEELPDAPSD